MGPDGLFIMHRHSNWSVCCIHLKMFLSSGSICQQYLRSYNCHNSHNSHNNNNSCSISLPLIILITIHPSIVIVILSIWCGNEWWARRCSDAMMGNHASSFYRLLFISRLTFEVCGEIFEEIERGKWCCSITHTTVITAEWMPAQHMLPAASRRIYHDWIKV